MEKKLTFLEYLESKKKLREAVENIPQRTARYSVRKYCKLVVGESKDDKQYINLKPKHQILIEWRYDTLDNPTPLSIQFDGPNVNPDEDFDTFWSGEKLLKWLSRNANEK